MLATASREDNKRAQCSAGVRNPTRASRDTEALGSMSGASIAGSLNIGTPGVDAIPATESRVKSPLSIVGIFLLGTALLAAIGCGSSEASRSRAAQSGAEKYIELVKVGKYDEAYRRTFSKKYQLQIDAEAFVQYRGGLGAATGPIKNATLVKVEPRPVTNGFRITYALEGERRTQPVFEILDMIEDGDEWKVEALDMSSSGAPAQ